LKFEDGIVESSDEPMISQQGTNTEGG